MLGDALNIAAGLLVGLFTGFFFEKRGHKASKQQHEATLDDNQKLRDNIEHLEGELKAQRDELTEKVRHVQESVYSSASVGKTSNAYSSAALAGRPDCEVVLETLRDRLGVDGKASLVALRGDLVEQGFSKALIDETMNDLADSGTVRIEGRTVEIL